MNRLNVSSPNASGLVAIRLDEAYFERMGEIIQCVVKAHDGAVIKRGQQLVAFETNRCLASIKAPISGKVFQEERFNRPSEITHETVLFWIDPERT